MFEKLIEVMNKKNLTRHKLAMLSNINPPDLYNALEGKKPMYPSWRKRIANALGVKETDVFDD